MTRDELTYPLGRLLTHLRLQLDFQHAVREQLFVRVFDLVERPIDANVDSTPVLARSHVTVPIVFSNKRELRVERNADTGVTRQLESSAVVERAHHCGVRRVS